MGFGPIVMGIVYWIIEMCGVDINLSGLEMLISIISVSLVAFVHAGSSVFHQIEHWAPIKAAFAQLSSLYVVYIFAYLVNSWLPLKWEAILIFTIIIILSYFIIWLIIHIITKNTLKKLNDTI